MPDLLLIFHVLHVSADRADFLFFLNSTQELQTAILLFYIISKNVVDFTNFLCYNVYNSCFEQVAFHLLL